MKVINDGLSFYLADGEQIIGKCVLIKESFKKRTIEVSVKLRNSLKVGLLKINYFERRKGYGTYLLSGVLKFADEHKHDLYLRCMPLGATSKEDLMRFYESFGFVAILEGIAPVMIRKWNSLNANKGEM